MNYSIDLNREYLPSKLDMPVVHLTQKWNTLVSILQEGLKPSYCKENLMTDSVSKCACFPMISMSNMSIREAIQFQKSYGTFGIALDVSWAQMNGFNPVLYLEQNSDLTRHVVEMFDYIKNTSFAEILEIVSNDSVKPKDLLTRTIVKIFAHSKNFDGQLIRNKVLVREKYPFGLEREWRKIIVNSEAPYTLVGDDIAKRHEFNSKIKNIRVNFDWKQLRGVIVETEHEASEVREIIKLKYNLAECPSNIDIVINSMRHVPDEG